MAERTMFDRVGGFFREYGGILVAGGAGVAAIAGVSTLPPQTAISLMTGTAVTAGVLTAGYAAFSGKIKDYLRQREFTKNRPTVVKNFIEAHPAFKDMQKQVEMLEAMCNKEYKKSLSDILKIEENAKRWGIEFKGRTMESLQQLVQDCFKSKRLDTETFSKSVKDLNYKQAFADYKEVLRQEAVNHSIPPEERLMGDEAYRYFYNYQKETEKDREKSMFSPECVYSKKQAEETWQLSKDYNKKEYTVTIPKEAVKEIKPYEWSSEYQIRLNGENGIVAAYSFVPKKPPVLNEEKGTYEITLKTESVTRDWIVDKNNKRKENAYASGEKGFRTFVDFVNDVKKKLTQLTLSKNKKYKNTGNLKTLQHRVINSR